MKVVTGFLFGSIYTASLYTDILYNWNVNSYPILIIPSLIFTIGTIIIVLSSIFYIDIHWKD